MVKYIFITGGVLSGLGKGVITASIGFLLKSIGFNVTALKIDPYVNVDAGTMNPYMHGEVFVTEDGGETDLDLGHYERFLDIDLSKDHNVTSGKIFYNIIMKERRGEYLGKCVQIVPHVTDEIKRYIRETISKSNADIGLVEIGGTVGDIESLPFLEAVRQMRVEEGFNNTLYVHVTLAPVIHTGEQKTKPVQHSVNELRRIGIQPDIIIVRSLKPLDDENRVKIALHATLPINAVYSVEYTDTIYRIPLILHKQGFVKHIVEKLGLDYREPDLSRWIDFVNKLTDLKREVVIAMIGKYTKIRDSYLSIIEALKHSSVLNNVSVKLEWFESTVFEEDSSVLEKLDSVDGAIILPGFGVRGSEGKIIAIKYLREREKPILGICFGMQLMVIEYARNVIGLNKANSTEIDPNTPHPVIDLLESQKNIVEYGGSMRLGSFKIRIVKNTHAWLMYGREEVYERHRHRYGVNNKYVDLLENNGLIMSGWSDGNIVEFIEMKDYKTLYFGTQAHPEYKSRPLKPSPVFNYFIKKVVEYRYKT
ncbi:MAG: CTP synthase [Desulfurococcaceae archaeon]|uniref:CTP synthase n=1 Tax=Staphylothermus marinus TaxID=2280 RepID=A0A7C4D6G9_STAMA